ncbi:MAG: HEPN domain-containing protein [Deltaproteobacteria bacterium]|nr:HEPN domain-containing protein [Deltaproteobacteria bacterium]MBW2071445.1 HEPN domain-containing protein [Deltaproteobacteria bacterium]
MNRSRDWWIQAQADLRHAQNALEDGDYDWACFAAHQAAEKALKAIFEQRQQKVWGHSVTRMLQVLQEEGVTVGDDLLDAARTLDKHYIPTRYPNGLEQGAPTEFYTRKEAEDAISYSQKILRFSDHLLGG